MVSSRGAIVSSEAAGRNNQEQIDRQADFSGKFDGTADLPVQRSTLTG